MKVPISVLVISLASNDFLVGAVSILLWIYRWKSRSIHVSYIFISFTNPHSALTRMHICSPGGLHCKTRNVLWDTCMLHCYHIMADLEDDFRSHADWLARRQYARENLSLPRRSWESCRVGCLWRNSRVKLRRLTQEHISKNIPKSDYIRRVYVLLHQSNARAKGNPVKAARQGSFIFLFDWNIYKPKEFQK